jgi:hypothetical protein
MSELKSEGERESRINPELMDAVQDAFTDLSEMLKGGDKIFVDENGNERYLVLTNPAGNLSIHNYQTGVDYLLWEDGEIESLLDSDSGEIIDLPTPEELDNIIDEIKGKLTERELPEYSGDEASAQTAIMKSYMDTLKTEGNLSEEEIIELTVLEFTTIDKLTLEKQLKRYYLKFKSKHPKEAEQMKTDVDSIMQKGVITEKDIERIFLALQKYLSSFAINFGGHFYSFYFSKMTVDGKEIPKKFNPGQN